MPIYPALSFLAVGVVLVVELVFLRTGLLAQRAYWIAMAIVYGFMVLVDGWLTKLSAPIVVYRPDDVSGWRPMPSQGPYLRSACQRGDRLSCRSY